MAFRVLLLLLLPVFSVLAAEEIHEYVQVELVDLYLTATDSKGHFISDLRPEELIVKEDGIPQQIERFGPFRGEHGENPMLLATVIDNSGSMDSDIGGIRRLDLSRNAALLLLKQLGPLDQVMLVHFSDTPVFTKFMPAGQEAEKVLQEIKPIWGYTAVVDSLATVLKELSQHAGRKILFLCTDGQDNISQTKFKDVIAQAADAPDLTVVVLGVGATNSVVSLRGNVKDIPDVPYLRSREYLQKLADDTAGFAYFPKNEKDVASVLELMGSFIRSQYYLSYKSSQVSSAGARHKIEITTKRRGVKLHYRQGYTVN